MNNSVTLLLIGDCDRRDAIKRGLTDQNIDLAGEIFEPDSLRLVPLLAPDVVVLDFAANGINSLVALQWLNSLPESPKIIAVGVAGSPVEQQFALELGADAYATLETPSSIRTALRSVTRSVPGSWTSAAA